MKVNQGKQRSKQDIYSCINVHILSGRKTKKQMKNSKGLIDTSATVVTTQIKVQSSDKKYKQKFRSNYMQVEELNRSRFNDKETQSLIDPIIKQNLQQGVTIISKKSQQKILVHYYVFQNEEEYEFYTDNLIYRFNILRSSKKIKNFINPVEGIYVQKDKTADCSSCKPCLAYKVYIIEKYYPNNFQTMLQEGTLSYSQIKNILHSYCMVMSVYQQKRLRIGLINFCDIYVTKLSRQSTVKRTAQTLADHSQLKQQKPYLNEKDPQKLLDTYFCKISDPEIKKTFARRQKHKQASMPNEADVYKYEVYHLGYTLNQYMMKKQKKSSKLKKQQQISKYDSDNQEQEAKQFILNLIQKHMICSSSVRYNWLQLQRYFQNYNNNKAQNRKLSMIPTQSKLSYKQMEQGFKSISVDKLISKDQGKKEFTYYVPGTSKIQNNIKLPQNVPLNKQNASASNTSFINLKPLNKSNSKPNIANETPNPLTPRHQVNISPSIINNVGYMSLKSLSITNQNLQTPSFNFPISQSKYTSQITKQQKNSGYGVVQNPYPEYIGNGKIQYQNLYNIGKAWSKFEGSFIQGVKEGPGTIYLTNGHIFNGYFIKDLANGKGSVYIDGQLALKGTWRNNILVTQF